MKTNKCSLFLLTATACLLLGSEARVRAAAFVTKAVVASGNSWSSPAIWSNPPNTAVSAPVAGNTYELLFNGTAFGNNLNNTRLRNPAAAGVQTFPGDSLTMNANTEIRPKTVGAILNFPGVGGAPGLILNGGALGAGDTTVFEWRGIINVVSPSLISPGDNGAGAIINGRGAKFNATLTGSGSLIVIQGPTNVASMEVVSANNTYSGTWIVKAGFLKGSAVGSLGTGNIVIDPGYVVPTTLVTATLAAGPARFEVTYDINTAGTLTLTNGGVMVLHQNCSFSGVTINGTALTAGAHPYSELVANFPANFAGGGSGSITVVPPGPPFAPLNVTASSGDTQVTLNWSPAANAAGYFIERSSTSGGPYLIVGSTNGTSFVDAGLANNTTNYYVIVATNILGESTNSSEVVGVPNDVVVGITAVGATNQITVNWTALASAASYSVQRATSSGGPFADVATGLAGTSFVDAPLANGTVYFYRVSAVLTNGSQSSRSATVSAATAPSAPVLNAVLFASTVIRVGWTSPDTANQQFFIESSTDGANFSFLAMNPANRLSFTNTGLTLSNTYYYRVQASNAAGLSAHSNIASTNTPAFGYNVNFGSAPDASAGALNSPTPPGYLNDTGAVFAARGNGFSYGWTTLGGTNIGRDTRWRQNAISPDLRYDTFVHMMKAGLNSPNLAAFWEFEVPNGPYIVRIVAGESDNTDGVYQFEVEGAVTGTYTPGAGPAHWGEFIVTTAVSDGRLTIKTGPSSVNNKLAFVDIYPDIPVPPIISINPQSQAVEENRPVTLSVTLSQGSPTLSYQWYFNNAPLTDATNRTLVFPHIQTSAQGDYYLIVTNYGGAATSTVATVTVSEDTTAPSIVSIGSLDGLTIGVCFDEELDPTGAVELGNYAVNEGAANITNIIRRLDGRSVALQIDAPITGPFTVQVFSLADLSGNLADGVGASNVVVGLSTGDIGNPLRQGSHYTCDNEIIELVGGGTDIWNAADQFHFAWRSFAGDFDMRTRVTSLAGANAITKAAIVARESTNAGSPVVHVSVNPLPPGRDLAQMAWRPTEGATSTTVGTTITPGGLPNAWLRLQRAGSVFTGYHSTNGSNWTIIGQTTNQALGSTLLLGLGLTAHDTNLLATGIFSNFRITSPSTAIVLTGPTYSNGTFSASFQSAAGVNYQVQYRTNLPPQCAPGAQNCPPDTDTWPPLLTIPGDGTVKTFTDPTVPLPDRRFYRVVIVP